MPIIKAAKKYIRVSARKNSFNKKTKEAVKNSIRKVIDAISEKKKGEAEKLFTSAQKAIDKAAKRGILKKNTAARKKSSLIKKIKSLS